MTKTVKALMLGIALLAVSCSKDKGVSETPSEKETVKLELTMEATLNQDELRNAMQVEMSEANRYKLELPKFKDGDILPLTLAFSNGATLDHHKVDFIYKGGKFKFSGTIGVTGYSASGDVTSRQWYVMAFFGSSRYANEYHYAPQLLNLTMLATDANGQTKPIRLGPDNNSPHTINVPFASGWTPVHRTGDDKGHFSVSLKPLGYFIRLQVANKRDHKIKIQGFEVESADYTHSPIFVPDYTQESMKSGAMPSVRSTRFGATYLHYTGGHTVEAGTEANPTMSDVYFVWLMPKTKKTDAGKVKLNVVHYHNGGAWRFPFELSIPASTNGLGGKQTLRTLTVKNDHKIYRPLQTLDYVALGNVNASGNELASDADYNGNQFAYPQASSIPLSAGARFMAAADWLDILPSSVSVPASASYTGGGTAIFRSTAGTLATSTDSLTFASKTITYAKRFTNTDKQVAYRYELSSTGDLTIKLVYLGKDIKNSVLDVIDIPTAKEIASEAYWADAEAYGEVVTRRFKGAGSTTLYMGASPEGNAELTLWNTTSGTIGHGISNTGKSAQVRLMHSTPFDIPAKL